MILIKLLIHLVNKCTWQEKELEVRTINILMFLAISKKLVTDQNMLKVKGEKHKNLKKLWIQPLTAPGKASQPPREFGRSGLGGRAARMPSVLTCLTSQIPDTSQSWELRSWDGDAFIQAAYSSDLAVAMCQSLRHVPCFPLINKGNLLISCQTVPENTYFFSFSFSFHVCNWILCVGGVEFTEVMGRWRA